MIQVSIVLQISLQTRFFTNHLYHATDVFVAYTTKTSVTWYRWFVKKNIVGSGQAAPCKQSRIHTPQCSNTEIQQKPYQPTHPFSHDMIQVQSTLVISNSKGLSEILWDIRTSTYQICRIEEKLIRLTTFNKYMCNWTLEVRDILNILWKRGEIAPWEQFLLFSIIFFTLLDFHV